VQTAKWFGLSWGAPINTPENKIPVPIDEFCVECDVEIRDSDQGFSIPHLSMDGKRKRSYYHKRCFFLSVLGPELTEEIEK